MSRTFVVQGPHNPIDVTLIASILREDYRHPPWNEDQMCPHCKKADDFGPEHTYGVDGPEQCPVCSSPLTSFWSDERMTEYINRDRKKPGFMCLEARESGTVSGWLWGYYVKDHEAVEGGGTAFYIDVFMVHPQFRGVQRNRKVIRQAIVSTRQNDWARMEELSSHSEMPVCAALFLKLGAIQMRNGCHALLARTHQAAVHVKSLLKVAALVPVAKHLGNDPNRQYWLRKLQ